MLDPARDPDRYDSGKDVPPDVPFEEPDRRDYLAVLYGLLAVFGFLAVVTLLIYLGGV